MEIYTGKVIPARFSIAKSMEYQSKVVFTKILNKLEGKDIFLALDEITDTLTVVHDCSVSWSFIWLFFGSYLSH
uniref:Uncharacterized protein n=1 Tax=Lepeophtheirus salmonis TaxID=72036 RepID=A0A0K2UX73_LEPSM